MRLFIAKMEDSGTYVVNAVNANDAIKRLMKDRIDHNSPAGDPDDWTVSEICIKPELGSIVELDW